MNYIKNFYNEIGQKKGLAIIFAIIIVLTLFLHYSDKITNQSNNNNKETEPTVYFTDEGELALEYPSDWTIGASTINTDSAYSLELNAPNNQTVIDRINRLYDIDLENPDINDESAFKALTHPIAADYTILYIDIVKNSAIKPLDSLTEWAEKNLTQSNASDGTSFYNIQEITIDNVKGYKYNSKTILNLSELETTNYYLLNDLVQVEITIFPSTSNFSTKAQEIVNSIDFDYLSTASDDS